MTFTIGQFVRAVVPDKCRSDQFAYGRVCAHEVYTDDNGSRTWWYVRWIDADGLPDAESKKHAADELEAT